MGRALDPGPHHVAAIRRGPVIELLVDTAAVASSESASGRPLDLGVLPPLTVGHGPRARFAGDVAAVRVFAGALDSAAIAALADDRPFG
jgi:hypothetical protein